MKRSLRSLVSTFFRRSRVEAEIEEELRTHIQNRADDLGRSGLARRDAERQARIEFGGYQKFKEECRQALGAHLLHTFLQDVRYGLRILRKSPGFTSVAVLTLALGIGANTAIFALFDGLVLRNLRVPQPEQIVRFGVHAPDNSFTGLSLPMFQEIAQRQNVFSGMFAWSGDAVLNVETDGALSRADVWAVDGNFSSELGAVPEIGRLIGPQDVDLKAASALQVAVLGYDFWQNHYAGDPGVIDKTLKIEGIPFKVIGVTRREFSGMSADIKLEVIVPFTAEPLVNGHTDMQKYLRRPASLWLEAAARLRPGVTLQQATAQLDSLWPSVRQDMASQTEDPDRRNHVNTLLMKVESGARGASFVRGKFSRPLAMLMAIAGLVLLIACANLASLMLARSAARSREMGVRVALGAGRARLARQMLTESLILSAAGTLAGVVFAFWASRALSQLILGEIYIVPAELNLQPDLRVLGFAALAAILTGVLFGLAPAWRATTLDPNSMLQQQNASAIGSQTGRLGRKLIVMQVALSMVLLASGGLLVKTLENLRSVDPGFLTRGLLQVDLYPKPNGYKNLDLISYYHELQDRVSNLPEVESAALNHIMIAGVLEWTEKIRIKGTNGEGLSSDLEMAMPNFFHTINIRLLQGRDFVWQDDDHAPRVAVVSKNFAEKFFPASDAIGQHIDVTSTPGWKDIEIVGIVSDASLYDVRKHDPPTVYLPLMQYGDYMGWSQLLVRTRSSQARALKAVERVVVSLGHEYVPTAKTLEQNIDRSLLQERVTALLSGFFGGLALLLAGVGLYGLMSYTVTRRTREIGIRMALGAERNGVLRLFLRETLMLVSAGVVIGILCAMAATRLLSHMLFGLSPKDPLTLLAVSVAMIVMGALAGCLPAVRAMRTDPLIALRSE